jgi:hypothetical protein
MFGAQLKVKVFWHAAIGAHCRTAGALLAFTTKQIKRESSHAHCASPRHNPGFVDRGIRAVLVRRSNQNDAHRKHIQRRRGRRILFGASVLNPDGTISGRSPSGAYAGKWRISGNEICFSHLEGKRDTKWNCTEVKLRGGESSGMTRQAQS